VNKSRLNLKHDGARSSPAPSVGCSHFCDELNACIQFSVICVFFLAMTLNAIAIILALPYFTIALAIMSGFAYEELKRGLNVSRFKKFGKQIVILIFATIILFGIIHWVLNII